MESTDSHSALPLQGSFEGELSKIFFAMQGADRTRGREKYFSEINLFLSKLCFHTCGDEADTWLSVEFPTSDRA